ncbi:MAG: hypothetical protein ACLTLE_02700 [Lachnospiraceae bacterium]
MRAGKWYFVTLLMAAAFWLAGSNCTAQEMTKEHHPGASGLSGAF